MQASPPGLAQKWLNDVNRNINSLNCTKVRLSAAGFTAGLQTEWQKLMLLHGEELIEIRMRMEGVRCESEKAAPNLFARAETAIGKFKEDQQALNALLNMRDKNTSRGA